MDIWSKEKRSDVMSRIRGKDTKPELAVRSMLHRHGFRFRVHSRKLPGTPDIVLPRYKTVVFIHGCFWHQHKDCLNSVMPKTHTERWKEKLSGNVLRDRMNAARLSKEGWQVVTIWECQIEKGFGKVEQKILGILNSEVRGASFNGDLMNIFHRRKSKARNSCDVKGNYHAIVADGDVQV